MLPGAPQDSELSIRLTYSRTYKPIGGEAYADAEFPDGKRTMLGFLLYDKDCIDQRYYGLDVSPLMAGEGLEIRIELVDTDGRVWTEEYEAEDEVTLPPETKEDLEHIFG